MSKDKSKKKSKSSGDRDEDLAKMKAKYAEQKHRSEGGGGGGEKKFDELKVGRNNRRVLPRLVNGKLSAQFYTESAMHFKVGPNRWTVRCIGEKYLDKKTGRPTPGTPCPICKKFLKEQDRINGEYPKGDDEGKRKWKEAKEAYCPRTRYYFNVLVPDGNDGVDVKCHTAGDQIMEQLLGYFFEDDSDIGDFTAIDAGCWLNFKRIGEDRNTKYKVFGGESFPIEDMWDDIKPMLSDLDAACGELRTAEAISNIMKGIKEADDDDASDDGSSEDEDDESSEEEDEDNDDSSNESEDDEDEEDEKPVKKSKLSEKMKAKLKKKSK